MIVAIASPLGTGVALAYFSMSFALYASRRFIYFLIKTRNGRRYLLAFGGRFLRRPVDALRTGDRGDIEQVIAQIMKASLRKDGSTAAMRRIALSRSISTWSSRKRAIMLASGKKRWDDIDDLESLLASPQLSSMFMDRCEQRLAAGTISFQTARQYSCELNMVLDLMNRRCKMLELYATAMFREAQQVTVTVAVPLPRRHMETLINDPTICVRLRSALWIMWKTCSRFSDLLHVRTPLQLTTVTLKVRHKGRKLPAFFIHFKRTKSETQNTPRGLVLVTNYQGYGLAPTDDIKQFLLNAREDDPILIKSDAKKIVKLMSRFQVHDDDKPNRDVAYRKRFTLHSVKRGALMVAWKSPHIANVAAIQQLGKHKSPQGDELGAVAIAYAPDKISVARKLASHQVTAFL